jgi:hypothetical protein
MNSLILEYVINKWGDEVASYSFAHYRIIYDSFSEISYGFL